MDWPLNTPKFAQEDLEQLFSCQEKPPKSKGVARFWNTDDLEERALYSDRDVCQWLELSEAQNKYPGMCFILASCHEHEAMRHNPAHLRKVPFSYEAFQQITSCLPLHGDTARIISRSDMPFFEEIDLFSKMDDNIYYCCRTSGLWAGDLAVSCVFNPSTGFTSGVVFGCSDDVAEEIAGRIENSEDAWMHPLLMVGILVEIEKTRHMKLVEDHLFKLLQRVQNVSKSPEILPTSQLVRENYSVDLWIEVSQLKIALIAWRAQLTKMDAHIQELDKSILGELPQPENIVLLSPCSVGSERSDDSNRTLTSTLADGLGPDKEFHGLKASRPWRTSAREEGRRIQRRLREIMSEYDCKLRECSMVLDGVSLSAQLSWNQIGFQDTRTNMKIASATCRDGNQMRLIALLTMVFLPATFLASLFSMTFFNWDASEGEQIVSPYVWIYSVAVVPITAMVVGLWYYLTKRARFSDAGWAMDDKV